MPGAQQTTFTTRYLQPAEYPGWDRFVDASPTGSVYSKSWFLELLGNYRIKAVLKHEELQAGMALPVNRLGMHTNPLLCKYLGVVGNPANRHQVACELALAASESGMGVWEYAFHPGYENWLPFYWSGFAQTTRYSYRIEFARANRHNGHYDSALRRLLRKAHSNELRVDEVSTARFVELIQLSYRQNGTRCPFHGESLQRLVDRLEGLGAFYKRGVYDGAGKLQAAGGVLHDANSANLVLHGMDRQYARYGSNAFLIDHLIEFAASRCAVFDFEGSMRANIERFYRRFGGQLTAYSVIRRKSLATGVYQQAIALARRWNS